MERELGRHRQLVSPIKMIPLGCKSPLLKHVVSFRSQVFMILKNKNSELELAFKFRVDDFDYTIYATLDNMKCFGCGMEGHLIRSCRKRNESGHTGQAPQQVAQSLGVGKRKSLW